LALAQAGAFIERTNVDVQTYIGLFEDKWSDLMEKQGRFPLQEYAERSMLTTWMISYEHVLQENEIAASLMKLWPFFHHDDIWHGLISPSFYLAEVLRVHWLVHLVKNKIDFFDAMGMLAAYSLVEKGGPESYSMHPVLHKWCEQLSTPEEKPILQRLSVAAIGFSNLGENSIESWKEGRRSLSHVLHVSNRVLSWQYHDMEDDIMPICLFYCDGFGKLFSMQGKLREAEQMYQRSLAEHEAKFGLDHPLTLNAVNSLGNLYF